MPEPCALRAGKVSMKAVWVLTVTLPGVVLGMVSAVDEQEIKFAECPAAVRKTFLAEAKGAKIESLTKEKDDDTETVYWADITLGGKTYAMGVLEDGTLTEMNLAVDEEKMPFDRCPAAVQESFRIEAFGEKVDAIGRDMKYGVTIYQTVVKHQGKAYEIVIADDGTLVEKVLVIDDEEVKFADCPAAVRAALHAHANGGEIGDITRSTGIGHATFEAEVKIKARVYLIDVAENGLLISKSLEAVRD
jgi:hypothetical protein